MAKKKTLQFEGFPPEMIDFLWELRMNNNKEWFEPNKWRYLQYVKEPMEAFAQDVYQRMAAFDPDFSKIIHVSRIYRDMRRVKGGDPYKDRIWMVFKPFDKEFYQRQVFFLEITPETWCYGFGSWSCTARSMKSFRNEIDTNMKEFEKIVQWYESQDKFQLSGESYKRKIPSAWPENIQNWYQRKSISLIYEAKIDQALFHKDLAKTISKEFQTLYPIYTYFDRILSS